MGRFCTRTRWGTKGGPCFVKQVTGRWDADASHAIVSKRVGKKKQKPKVPAKTGLSLTMVLWFEASRLDNPGPGQRSRDRAR